jgi:hypothetical protein
VGCEGGCINGFECGCTGQCEVGCIGGCEGTLCWQTQQCLEASAVIFSADHTSNLGGVVHQADKHSCQYWQLAVYGVCTVSASCPLSVDGALQPQHTCQFPAGCCMPVSCWLLHASFLLAIDSLQELQGGSRAAH